MKLIVDKGTLSPAEKARLNYYRLYEKQVLIKHQKENTNYLDQLKQILTRIL